MAHAHGPEPPAPPRTRWLLAAVMVPVVIATVAGLVALWPGHLDPLSASLGAPDDLVDARVVAVERGPCTGTPEEAGIRCSFPTVELLEGADAGDRLDLTEQSEAGGAHRLEVDDTVVLSYFADAQPGFQYAFADLERRTPLLLLALLFGISVVLLGRWRGVLALVGLAGSLAVLAVFVLPAILEGSSPVAVALVGAAAIGMVAVYLAHGFNVRSTTAVLGTLASLVLIVVLGQVFVDAARFTGLADEEAGFLQITAAQVDLRGLLLAGIVIGALGVLDDVTVTQVSAVWELRRANPAYSGWDLYRSAIRIGRDHIASTVNTLVLAYAGASLPLFLLFTQADQALGDVANGEVVAVEIVRTLAGSIGLVASVPITTALAAAVVVTSPVAPAVVGPTPAPGGWWRRVRPRRTTSPDEGADVARPGRPRRRREPDPRRFRSRRERDFWDE